MILCRKFAYLMLFLDFALQPPFLLGFPVAVFLHFVGITAFEVAFVLGFPRLVLFATVALGGCGVLRQRVAVAVE